MMNSTQAAEEARRKAADDDPPVMLSTTDADRLSSLAASAARRSPEVAQRLLAEIDRADLLPPDELPPDVVAMYSYVEYRDEGTGAARQVQLVYPHEADIAQGRISVLTLVGAALLGLRAGQAILWPKQDGQERRLTILRVSPQSLAPGA
ncbi:nucleoside diphosphate kinase regulator [Roseomonas sp. ACRSG]|nr:nucleoside diphosphate kinase regulator [Roseomonas sp. ACRSG]